MYNANAISMTNVYGHPIVGQEETTNNDNETIGNETLGNETLGNATLNETLPGGLDEDGGNSSNYFKFKFKNSSELVIQRTYWNAFLAGANSSWYAPNASICFNTALNLY